MSEAVGPTTAPAAGSADEDLTSGTISFFDSFRPQLADGRYEIVVGQRVRPTPSEPSTEPPAFDEVYVNRTRFRVEGPQVRLMPDEVRASFPPPSSVGEYENVLPHVVLERKTLPWERSALPGPDDVNFAGSDDPAKAALEAAEAIRVSLADGERELLPQDQPPPWLALLVLHATDEGASTGPIPWPAKRIPVEQFRDEPPAHMIWSRASIAPSPPPSASSGPDVCQVIEVPASLWLRIAPRLAELPLLAHARHVVSEPTPSLPAPAGSSSSGDGVASSSSSASVPAAGELAVIVGNRLPHPNARTTAHLVSLEGMAAHLPGGPLAPSGSTAVRLVSLHSWSFTSLDPNETFTGYLEAVDIGPLRVPASGGNPVDGRAVDGDALDGPDAAFVEQILGLGYAALDHQTSHGHQTVSWYRGPLLPVLPDPDAPIQSLVEIGRPVRSAQDMLRFDAELGMLDTSYAVAWQLGQLLGLRDAAFATALAAWKHANVRAQFLAAEHQVLSARLGPALAVVAAPDLPPGPDFPPVVAAWFDALRQLSGVPFAHLVPDERMLPAESLRLFQLDWNWIYALVEGAFSLGRTSPVMAAQDSDNHDEIHPEVGELAPVSGFLLRSGVVAGWPAMRVTPIDEIGRPLPVRLVHLSPSVLFGLVYGQMDRVEFSEPPEGLHFGVDIVEATDLAASHTYEKGRRTATAGAPVGRSAAIQWRNAPSTGSVGDGVIAIVQLYTALASANVADFALQMIEGVQVVHLGPFGSST